MEARAQPDASTAPTQATQPAADGLVDVEAILREVEALAGIAAKEAIGATDSATSPTASASESSTSHAVSGPVGTTPTAMSSTTATMGANLDVAALEREIESLLRGTNASDPVTTAPAPTEVAMVSEAPQVVEDGDAGPATESAPVHDDVRTAAFSIPSVDPMLRELEEILDDSNDAVLRQADGSIDRALDTVFDPRALSGQEEEVNRALIEAFGTSRRSTSAFAGPPAVVTNPVPRFEGISRAVPPELASESTGPSGAATGTSKGPTRTFEEIAAKSIARPTNAEYAGETPFEPAFPTVPPLAATETAATPVAESISARATDAVGATETPAPVAPMVPAPAPAAKAPVTMTSPVIEPATEIAAPAAKRRISLAPLFRRAAGLLSSVALLPLQLCALPMRAVPAAARGYVGIAAISMTLWVPVAWWMAQRSASAPGIGRVEFPVAPSENHAAAESAEASDGGDASDSAAPDASASTGAAHH
ncbi:MAG: hypothetical protein LW806_10235 [Planctomycetaceae bacterium]|nr:hypothetical protein [Planctomycetaceae bacterium]